MFCVVLNSDRPISDRVRAAIRWTLLPTTSYIDILKFIRENPELPVNIVDALYKVRRRERDWILSELLWHVYL